MVKLSKKLLIGIVIAVIVVAGILSFLSIPPEKEELYEIPKLAFLKNETYTYNYSLSIEALEMVGGQFIVDVVDVSEKESILRATLNITFLPLPFDNFTINIVKLIMPETKGIILLRMTKEGQLIPIEIEEVEVKAKNPIQLLLKVIMELPLKMLKEGLQPIISEIQIPLYPKRLLPIGGKWEIPIEVEVTELATSGKVTNYLEGKEKLITQAGVFKCFKITSVIDFTISSKENQATAIMGNSTGWVDLKKGIPIKLDFSGEMEERAGKRITKTPFQAKIEIVEA
jgi:hypothetical protein